MSCQRDWVMVFISSALLMGCAVHQRLAFRDNPEASDVSINYAIKSIAYHYDIKPTDDIALNTLMHTYRKAVQDEWGYRHSASSDEYIKYSNKYRTRVLINFAKGYVQVETLDRKDLRSAIVSALLMPDDISQADLLTDRRTVIDDDPMLYRQVLDHHGQPIRGQWRADLYADYLIEKHLFQRTIPKGNVYGVKFELVKNHIEQRSYFYSGLVRMHARKYDIDESLIYAVMRTESSFNPYAVSPANAYGLMQIVPSSGGRDVFRLIKKQSGEPTPDYLLQPLNNINIGTAYLYILKNVYLKDIKDPLSRRYAMIAAYNGGTRSVYRTFDKQSTTRAIELINAMTPEQVYNKLVSSHPLLESRNYLKKVLAAERDFYSGRA